MEIYLLPTSSGVVASVLSTGKLGLFPPGSLLHSHRETCSFPTRKLASFPPGSLLPSHRKTCSFPTGKACSLLTGKRSPFPPGSCVPSHRKAFPFPPKGGNLYHFPPKCILSPPFPPGRSFIPSHWKASFLPTGR